MAEKLVYQPLSLDEIKSISDSIEIGYQLIVVTLIFGDEIIGGLAKHWGWNGKEVSIGFNHRAGKKFGMSHIVEIPLDHIANIRPIPLADESIPLAPDDDPQHEYLRILGKDETFNRRLYVQDYPNPLATIFEKHNLEVSRLHGLKLTGYAEAALGRDSIPPEGIKLDRDFILYADWDFFSRQIHGAVSVNASIGVAGIAKDLSPSLQALVFKHLRENFQKVIDIQDVLAPTGIDEIFARGCILTPQPVQDTEIEGDKCILIVCANAQDTGEAVYPVLIKQKALKYPIEFLSQIRSPLVFYGEFLPVPIEVLGIKQQYTILARAIGYLQ